MIGFIIFILSKNIFDKNLILTEKLDKMSVNIIYGGFGGIITGLFIFVIFPGLLGYYFYYKLKKYLLYILI